MHDVLLVSMAVVDLQRPSLGLSLLKAILSEAGIASYVVMRQPLPAEREIEGALLDLCVVGVLPPQASLLGFVLRRGLPGLLVQAQGLLLLVRGLLALACAGGAAELGVLVLPLHPACRGQGGLVLLASPEAALVQRAARGRPPPRSRCGRPRREARIARSRL